MSADEEVRLDQRVAAGRSLGDGTGNRLKPRKRLYVVEVEGDCMVPAIESGDLVKFDPTLDPEDGDWVVATIEGERAIIKELRIEGGVMQRLLPLNGEPIWDWLSVQTAVTPQDVQRLQELHAKVQHGRRVDLLRLHNLLVRVRTALK